MSSTSATQFTAKDRQEVADWIDENLATLPPAIVLFLKLNRPYLEAKQNLPQRFNETLRELRRSMGILPSSERRRSGTPLGGVPKGRQSGKAKTRRERLAERQKRSEYLGVWHEDLQRKHIAQAERIARKMEKMPEDPPAPDAPPAPGDTLPDTALDEAVEPAFEQAALQDITDAVALDDIELTPEDKAECKARGKELAEHLSEGIPDGEEDGGEPQLESATETLMPGSSVVIHEEADDVTAELPPDIGDVQVVKTLTDHRKRYDISMAITPITLNVEKKVVVKEDGQRTVVSASTEAYGPARYSVTWGTLATLSVLVAQFAFPLNRLATMFTTDLKKFTAGGFGRMLHYVAVRLTPIYLKLAEQLRDSEILSGDDTSCRVVEVASYFQEAKKEEKSKRDRSPPPWRGYRTPSAAAASIARCEALKQERIRRRQDGDRDAKRTRDEDPSLGILTGQALQFESPRQDGSGGKESLNTTVMMGRSVAEDPRSTITFYRSHLGGFGNLLESILRKRNPSLRDVIVQADLSTTNLVKDPELVERFNFKLIGCSSHARRPFAIHESEDPIDCPHMLHLFAGLAMHEQQLNEYGRNRHNVLAVRQNDSRRLWSSIKDLAERIKTRWSKSTKLGTAARYIIKHYERLTAYLDDPRLEATNNFRERMLRTEKLIEKTSLFRISLEGRFALDIIRTVAQTAVAARVPVHEYLTSILRADPDAIEHNSDRFTPYAWQEERAADSAKTE